MPRANAAPVFNAYGHRNSKIAARSYRLLAGHQAVRNATFDARADPVPRPPDLHRPRSRVNAPKRDEALHRKPPRRV